MLKYSLKRSVDPVSEPVTLDELKSHLGISDNDQDTRLHGLLKAARRAVERDLRRSLITQTWQLTLDGGFVDAIQLHNPPVQSVSGITYTDADGNTQTVSTSTYDVDTASEPGIIRLAYAKSWPTTRGDDRDITITYVTGYGSASDVPDELKEAVKLAAQLMYDCPITELVNAYERIIGGCRVETYP